ncbi:hypothetical protein MJD09_01225 [bacterium]|nr:hypothetical protein [bacterium]
MDSSPAFLAVTAVERIYLLFEILGFSLTCIEVFFPQTADRIEDSIERIGNPEFLTRFLRLDLLVMAGALFGVVLCAGFLISIAIATVISGGTGEPSIVLQNVFVWASGLLVLALAALASLHIMSKVLRFLNGITRGRALGSIGLTLLLIDIIGGAYPLLVG